MRTVTPGAASVDVATVSEDALEAATSSPTPDSSDEPFKLLPTDSEHLPLAYHRLDGGSPGIMFLPGFMSNMTSGKVRMDAQEVLKGLHMQSTCWGHVTTRKSGEALAVTFAMDCVSDHVKCMYEHFVWSENV